MENDPHAEVAAWQDFLGTPEEFERAFLNQLLHLSLAESALWLQKEAGGGWQRRSAAPGGTRHLWSSEDAAPEIDRLASEATEAGAAVKRYPAGSQVVHLAAARLAVESGQAVAVLRLPGGSDQAALEAARRVRLLAEAPLVYQLKTQVRKAEALAQRFARVLDLMVLVNSQEHFMAAAMVVCNEVSARFACDRVSLGWLAGDRIRLRAISHGEKFERGREAVAALEAAMEEAIEQDAELLWPEGDSARLVLRSHAAFAGLEHCACVATVPLRPAGAPTGALTLEKTGRFPEETLDELRMIGDQVARRLDDLRRRDRWFGARWIEAARARAARLLGSEHTGAKLAGLCAFAVLAALPLVHIEYRFHAPFTLKCDTLAQLPAPFDGYIEDVQFRLGDKVAAGQVLMALDTKELRLEEAAALALVQQHETEAQKAESEGDVATMRIAQAEINESRARLAIISGHLAQAEVTAPFEGYVVEGDLREKLGAPVKQGDILLKVARIDALYPEVRIPEESISLAKENEAVRVAFASRPRDQYPAVLENIEPISVTDEKGNFFIGRCGWTAPREDWWRPGMSGEARVAAGSRSLLWILTHRTADVLRMRLWW